MLIVNAPVDDAGHEEEGHPERPARLLAAMAGVADLHLGDEVQVVDTARPRGPNLRGSTTRRTSTNWAPTATRAAVTSTRTPTPPTTRGASPNGPRAPGSR